MPVLLTVTAAADWIAQRCVATDGTLTVRPDGRYVSGYFGNITALGLVRAGLHLDVVRNWMTWYIGHAHGSGSGVDGVPDDGSWEGEGFVSRGRPDSTDAYGATFLILANAAYQSGDRDVRALIRSHHGDIVRIGQSMLATLQSSGLTWSRPQHPFAYAIDNVQVYRGLIDGAALMEDAFGDARSAATWRTQAQFVRAGIETTLWDPSTQTYRPVINRIGVGAPADLARPYPDALAQVMAIVYGAVAPSSQRAASLLARAAPSLTSAAEGDPYEYRIVVDLARALAGTAIPDEPFTAPPVCADAGWYLMLRARAQTDPESADRADARGATD
jgi:hypothetical protein